MHVVVELFGRCLSVSLCRAEVDIVMATDGADYQIAPDPEDEVTCFGFGHPDSTTCN